MLCACRLQRYPLAMLRTNSALLLRHVTIAGTSVPNVYMRAVAAAQQVSAGLTAPRIFKQKASKPSKGLQTFGPLHRSVSRTHNFAYNPAMEGSDSTPPFKFVRPDCPPDAAETSAPNGLSKADAGSRNAAKQVRNTARSALEQVGWSQVSWSHSIPL